MKKSMEFSGKTIDEAIAKALSHLGLEREKIEVEIIERGKSGFLGIGATDAVIRVEYEGEDEPVQAAVPETEVTAPKAEKKPEPAKKEPKADKPAPKASPVQEDKPRGARPVGNQAQEAESFISGLLEHMGVQANIEITPREGGGLDVNLSGTGIGAVIGRRGETLDAIQHLTNYAVNRGSDKHAHISVDAENYRAKREESLIHLAEKMAGKAIKYKRSMALEPMNSYERHVIHAALQDYEGVTTSSTGAEPNRRVVVSYVPTAAKKQESGDYKEWC